MANKEFITSIINSGSFSKENYNSIQEPFFCKSISNNYIKKNIKTNILDEYNFPDDLKTLYYEINNQAVEFYFKDWVFMSLDRIIKITELYVENNQYRVIDFAYKYVGLGHCIIISFDPVDKRVFYRYDGGSNGFEREANFKFVINFVPNDGVKYDIVNFLRYVDSESDEELNFVNSD